MNKKNPLYEFQKLPTVLPDEVKDAFTAKNKDTRAGTTSFELHGTDPASEAYSVLEMYSDGPTQQLFPTKSGFEMVVDFLNHYVPGRFTISGTTGLVTVDGTYKCRPTYLLGIIDKYDASNAPAIAYYDANKDAQGFCVWVGDLNGDNKQDMIFAYKDVRLLVWMMVYTV